MATATRPSIADSVLKKALLKEYGESIFHHSFKPTGYIPTGIPTLDYALGRPGYACGRVTVIRGDPSTGKSSLLHKAIAETQRLGGTAVLLETEDAIDLDRMAQLGVDIDKLSPLIFQPDTVETTLNLMSKVIEVVRQEAPDDLVLIGWDSVAATPTQREIDGEVGDASYGAHSRLISQAMRMLTRKISSHRICVIIVNQSKTKATTMPFQDPTTMIADRPLFFHATALLDVKRTGKEKAKGEDPTGINMGITVNKNKLAAPYRVADVDLSFTQGFDIPGSWLELGEKVGVLKKNGAWYTWNDQKFQARDWPNILMSTDVVDKIREVAFPPFEDTETHPVVLESV